MGLTCPPLEETEQRVKLAVQIKSMADKIYDENTKVALEPCCAKRCCCCCCMPPCPLPCSGQASAEGFPPSLMVCYKVPPKNAKTSSPAKGGAAKPAEESKVKASKSRELRAGILYVGCDCEKRNGLQDDCQRSECQGSPACVTKPKPTCGPSEFSNAKHLTKKGRHGKHAEQEIENAAGGGASKEEMDEYQCFPAYIKMPDCCCLE